MNPGIYYNVPEEEYRSWDCFCQSMVSSIIRSPKHLEYYIKNTHTSQAMIMGSLVDCLVFSEEEYPRKFTKLPDTYLASKGELKPWNMNSRTCRDIYNSITSSGRFPIKSDDLKKAELIKQEIFSHPDANSILENAKTQVSIVWVDTDFGILCKGRFDAITDESIIDLKTTTDASPGAFSRHIAKMGYHIQAAVYSEGWAALNQGVILPYDFIVAETEEPYCVATYALGDDSILAGKKIFKKALRKYKDYKESGIASGYSICREPIDVPNWAKDYEEEDNAGF